MLNNLLLTALLLAGAPARADEPPPEVKEFFSKNRAYRCEIAPRDARGENGSVLTLKDARGAALGKFSLGRVPFTLTISNDGRRLIAFYAGLGHIVSFYGVAFYTAQGKLLKEHDFNSSGPVAEEISADFRHYALADNRGEQSGLAYFNLRTGARLWQKKYKKKLNALKMSGDGKWFAAVFMNGEGRWRAALLDPAGTEVWGRDIKTRDSCFPSSISADGSEFTIAENRMVFSEADNYYHDTPVKKTTYSNDGGSVSEVSSEVLLKD